MTQRMLGFCCAECPQYQRTGVFTAILKSESYLVDQHYIRLFVYWVSEHLDLKTEVSHLIILICYHLVQVINCIHIAQAMTGF